MPDVQETLEQSEWGELQTLQLILFSAIKAYGKDNVLEIPNTDRMTVPEGNVRFTWVTSPTSIIVHLAEGNSLEELYKLEKEETPDES